MSWPRCFDQMASWRAQNLGPQWLQRLAAMVEVLRRGDQVEQMMRVSGAEGVTMADFVTREKARFFDMVDRQQDACDAVDVSVPLERQLVLFDRICRLIERDYALADKTAAPAPFARLNGLFKNLNHAPLGAPEHRSRLDEIEALDAATPSGGSMADEEA